MTDLITQLAARALDRTPMVQPRIESTFAPIAASMLSPILDSPFATTSELGESSQSSLGSSVDSSVNSFNNSPVRSSVPPSIASALVDPSSAALPIAHLPRWVSPPPAHPSEVRSSEESPVTSNIETTNLETANPETANLETANPVIPAVPTRLEGTTGLTAIEAGTTGLTATGMEPVSIAPANPAPVQIDRLPPQQTPTIAPISSPASLHPASTFTDSIAPTPHINSDSLPGQSDFSAESSQPGASSQPIQSPRSVQHPEFVQPMGTMENFSEDSTALVPAPLNQSSSPISSQASLETSPELPLVTPSQPSIDQNGDSSYLSNQLISLPENDSVNLSPSHLVSDSLNPIRDDTASGFSNNLSGITSIDSASHPLPFPKNDVSPIEVIKSSLPNIQRFSETGSHSTVPPTTIDSSIGEGTVPHPSMAIGESSTITPLPIVEEFVVGEFAVGESAKITADSRLDSRLDNKLVASESLTVSPSTALSPSTIEPVRSSNLGSSEPPFSNSIAQSQASPSASQSVNREALIVPTSDIALSRAEPLVPSLTQASQARSNDSSNQRENPNTPTSPSIVHAEINIQANTRSNIRPNTRSNIPSNADQLTRSQSSAMPASVVPIPIMPTLVPKAAMSPSPEAMPNSASSTGRQAGMNQPESALESSPPTINITIGRIDIRAIPQASPPARSRPAANPPKQSLQDYLNHRNGGGG